MTRQISFLRGSLGQRRLRQSASSLVRPSLSLAQRRLIQRASIVNSILIMQEGNGCIDLNSEVGKSLFMLMISLNLTNNSFSGYVAALFHFFPVLSIDSLSDGIFTRVPFDKSVDRLRCNFMSFVKSHYLRFLKRKNKFSDDY